MRVLNRPHILSCLGNKACIWLRDQFGNKENSLHIWVFFFLLIEILNPEQISLLPKWRGAKHSLRSLFPFSPDILIFSFQCVQSTCFCLQLQELSQYYETIKLSQDLYEVSPFWCSSRVSLQLLQMLVILVLCWEQLRMMEAWFQFSSPLILNRVCHVSISEGCQSYTALYYV